jgi:MFS family permease
LKISPTFLIVVTIFLDLTGFGMIIPLLPFYAEMFGTGPTALGVLVGSFSFMQFVFSPVLGRISDKIGRKPVLITSILISGASFILFALAESFSILLLSRIIAGMATESGVAQAYIADISNEEERAARMGKVGASVGAEFIIGPVIGGLISKFGFAAPGLAAAFLALMNLVFVILFLPESSSRKLFSEVVPNSEGGYFRGVKKALTKPLIGAILIINFIVTFAFSAVPVIVPLLGISFFRFGSSEMSYVFVYVGIIQVLLQGFLISRLIRTFKEETLILMGAGSMISGMLIMPILPNIAAFLAAITTLSSGIGIMNTVIPSFISKRTAREEQGLMLGVTQSISSVARVPSPLINGALSEYAGIVAPFLSSASLLAISFFLSCKILHACSLRKDGIQAAQTLYNGR